MDSKSCDPGSIWSFQNNLLHPLKGLRRKKKFANYWYTQRRSFVQRSLKSIEAQFLLKELKHQTVQLFDLKLLRLSNCESHPCEVCNCKPECICQVLSAWALICRNVSLGTCETNRIDAIFLVNCGINLWLHYLPKRGKFGDFYLAKRSLPAYSRNQKMFCSRTPFWLRSFLEIDCFWNTSEIFWKSSVDAMLF